MLKKLTANDIMTKDVVTIGPDSFLVEVVKTLLEKKISGMPVVNEEEKLVGVISEKDILNFAFCGHLRDTKVRKVMSKEIVHFTPKTEVNEIALSISKYHFRRVPIVKDEKVVGIVSRRDIIRNVL